MSEQSTKKSHHWTTSNHVRNLCMCRYCRPRRNTKWFRRWLHKTQRAAARIEIREGRGE